MATLQVETIVTVTADRGVRSALRNCLRSEAYRLEHCDSVISGSDAEAAHEALAHATHLVEMFDQLGWADNDPRERYEITVALDSFVPWLRGHRRDLAESIARETMEMTGITHDEVLDWRRELEAIDAFLERLDSMGQSTSRRSDSRPAVALRAGRRYASATPSTWST
jgi:hypothetical protein